MATDMAMGTRKNTAPNIAFALLVGLPMSVSAADLSFSPELSAELIYTDNVSQNEQASKSGEIGIFSAGLTSELLGKEGRISLDYQAKQTYHSYDSDKSKLYHELDFKAEKKLGQSGFTLASVASLSLLPAQISNNAITDVANGDLIQGRELGLALAYRSNPRKWIDLDTYVSTSLNRYEDDRGNNNDFDGSLSFKNGQRVKRVFWLLDGSYLKREARINSAATENLNYKIELGLPSRQGFSPFVRYYAESYLENQNAASSNTIGESESWGPALRYFRTKLSYIEISYNFSLNKQKNDDYIGAAVNLEPNRRTKLFFEYGRRFYGDAYRFNFSHQYRRLSSEISYVEEPSSFDRRFFVEGDIIAEQKLDKTLRWNSELELRRSSIQLELRHQARSSMKTLSDFIEDTTYGAGLIAEHSLTRQLRAAFKLDYDYYRFERVTTGQQIDRYNRYDLSLKQTFVEGFSLTYRYQFIHRGSNLEGRNYNENRVSINASKQF